MRLAMRARVSMHVLQAMCYKRPMKAALVLLLAASPAIACDWKSEPYSSPMSDGRACLVSSQAAKLSLLVSHAGVRFVPHNALRHHSLMVRIDSRPAILIGEKTGTGDARGNAAEAIAQIRQGQRLRTQFLAYPHSQAGDAAICNLPALIDACSP